MDGRRTSMEIDQRSASPARVVFLYSSSSGMDGRRTSMEIDQRFALDVEGTWVESITNKVGMSFDRSPPANPTIFRVPPNLRRGDQQNYEPRYISIGPYHRGMELRAMEDLKRRLLHHYLSIVPYESKNDGLRKMNDLGKEARGCYSEIIDLNNDQFVEMLLLDGCFLVQIFITLYDRKVPQAEELRSLLFNNKWFNNLILQDLLLLENQIPYFIIEHILDMLRMPRWNRSHFQTAAISSFIIILPQYSSIPKPKLPEEGFKRVDHLLHLFHKWISKIPRKEPSNTKHCYKLLSDQLCSTLSPTINQIGDYISKKLSCCCDSSRSNMIQRTSSPVIELLEETCPQTSLTVTELQEAGVKIEVRKAYSFLDISFNKDKGKLRIPAIDISDHTNFFFTNLVALEQCNRKYGLDITHYAMFLNDIINTLRDVEVLHQKTIIHRSLGDDEEIASLFNKLGNGVCYDPESNYLEDVYKDLNAYCQSSWPKWRAKAKRDYFNSPWAFISLLAATFLLVLTILQTAYTIGSYYKM